MPRSGVSKIGKDGPKGRIFKPENKIDLELDIIDISTHSGLRKKGSSPAKIESKYHYIFTGYG